MCDSLARPIPFGYLSRQMLRRLLLPRLALSAIAASGCAPTRDVDPADADTSAPLIAPASPLVDMPDTPTLEPERAEPRLHSLWRHVWIRERPSTRSPWLGFMGLGGSIPLREREPVQGEGCASFLAVEPRGFVCLDERTTLDPRDPNLEAIKTIAPRLDSPWPHHYAESRQSPRYAKLPTLEEQRHREFRLDDHLTVVDALRRGDFQGDIPTLLRDVDVSPSKQALPAFLDKLPAVHEHHDTLKAGSTMSWTRAFDEGGRTWLVTGDGVLVPKDRVAPYPRSEFSGVQLGGASQLPIGFVRERSRPQYVRHKDGTIGLRGAEWPRLASFGLTGRSFDDAGARYLETTQRDLLIREDDATVVRASARTPWGDTVESRDPSAETRWSGGPIPPPGGRRTWLEVSVHEGWLIAYEGVRPVFATLVATGRGEAATGRSFVQTSTLPGIFRIQNKLWTATMAVNSTAHFDVPFAMSYHGAYALHAAYWHDRWGEKVSLGCVNLSPRDARSLFLWSEPSIPEGWHGMRLDPSGVYATVVVIHG